MKKIEKNFFYQNILRFDQIFKEMGLLPFILVYLSVALSIFSFCFCKIVKPRKKVVFK